MILSLEYFWSFLIDFWKWISNPALEIAHLVKFSRKTGLMGRKNEFLAIFECLYKVNETWEKLPRRIESKLKPSNKTCDIDFVTD